MTVLIGAVARAIAFTDGRAKVVRANSMLAADPESTFAIALIKVVSEERVQAIAYGSPESAPAILTLWNPLSRDAGELEPFAVALDAYLGAARDAEALPRVWLPHGGALALLDVLHWRYRTNTQASEALRRMGWQCHALCEEARIAGQQVVAVASDLLRDHVVTGMSPIKEAHLGAMLAWVDPVPGQDPTAVADARALVPAAGMLERPDDDQIERLRKFAKKGDAQARAGIEAILSRSARAEWDRLVAARRAFWNLGLATGHGIDKLREESVDRIVYALRTDLSPASRPDALAHLLEREEHAMELREDVELRDDPLVRERARRAGRAVAGTVEAIVQPLPNRHPCTIVIRTHQAVLRVRRGTTLSNLANTVAGRVEQVTENAGDTLIAMRLEKGVSRRVLPAVGDTIDWVDSAPVDMSFMLARVGAAMRQHQPALAYQDQLPAAQPRLIADGDLRHVADTLRRPT